MSLYPLPDVPKKGSVIDVDQGIFSKKHFQDAKEANKLSDLFLSAYQISDESMEWRAKYPTLTKKLMIYACKNFTNEEPEIQEKMMRIFRIFSSSLPNQKTLSKKNLLDYIVEIDQIFGVKTITVSYQVNFAILCAKLPYFFTIYNFEKSRNHQFLDTYELNENIKNRNNESKYLEVIINSMIYGKKPDFTGYTAHHYNQLAQFAHLYGCSAQFATLVPKLARTYFSHRD